MENFFSNVLNHGKPYRKRKGYTIKDKDTQVSLIALRENCPNTEFFLVRIFEFSIFPNSGRMWENADQKKLRIWTLFTQCYQNVKIKISINLNVEESSLLGVSTVLILQ